MVELKSEDVKRLLTHCGCPGAFVTMRPTGKHHQPQESSNKAEYCHRNHVCLRVVR